MFMPCITYHIPDTICHILHYIFQNYITVYQDVPKSFEPLMAPVDLTDLHTELWAPRTASIFCAAKLRQTDQKSKRGVHDDVDFRSITRMVRIVCFLVQYGSLCKFRHFGEHDFGQLSRDDLCLGSALDPSLFGLNCCKFLGIDLHT